MAAGRGSRFGGYKQISEIDGWGHRIIDYSVYVAARVGFGRILFVINPDIEAEIRKIGRAYSEKYNLSVDFVTQTTEILGRPELAAKRKKPWGTGHAVACLKGEIKSPFALINADDFYGRAAFAGIFDFLCSVDSTSQSYAMVGYKLKNTLSKNGKVSRGVCRTEAGYLAEICEMGGIIWVGDRIFCDRSGGVAELDPEATVSVNLWGFTPEIIRECESRFENFLAECSDIDMEKREFYLPGVISELISEGRGDVRVLESDSVWQGVTYPEDRTELSSLLLRLTEAGEYPENL